MLSQALRETIRVQNGRIPLLDLHLARLEAGGCDATTLQAARGEAMRAAAAWSEPYGRMTLLVATDGAASSEVTDRPSTIQVPGGPTIALVETDVPQLPPGAAKPADRSFWDVALRQAQAEGADVAILVDSHGMVIDGSQATVWLVVDGQLHTPPSPPALAGVSRCVVFEIAERRGIIAHECGLVATDVVQADELFLTTAVAGAVPVRGCGGALCATIAHEFARIFAGET